MTFRDLTPLQAISFKIIVGKPNYAPKFEKNLKGYIALGLSVLPPFRPACVLPSLQILRWGFEIL